MVDVFRLERQSSSRTKSLFENRFPGKQSLWNVSEVAAFLRVSDRTVRDLVYKKRIPFRKVGRCVRFSPAEIEQWTLPHSKE